MNPRSVLFLPDRVLQRIDFNPDGCWLWKGALDPDGYGRLKGGTTAHRQVYAALVEPIPSNLQAHHSCHVPSCVNPRHVEVMTQREHVRLHAGSSSTHCRRGHPRTPENTYTPPNGRPHCRVCGRLRDAARNRRRSISC